MANAGVSPQIRSEGFSKQEPGDLGKSGIDPCTIVTKAVRPAPFYVFAS
jgi:hypothetical protein